MPGKSRKYLGGGTSRTSSRSIQRTRENGTLRDAHRRVLGIVDGLELLHLPLGIVLDHEPDRPEDRHDPRGAAVQILPHAVLEERQVDHAVGLGDADALGEVADRLRRVAAAAEPGEGRHPRVVPAPDVPLLDQPEQAALAHHRVGEVEARELDLLRVVDLERLAHPVVERPVVLVLEGAERVRDPLDRVRQGVRVVVHRIDAPARRRSGDGPRAGSGRASGRAGSCWARPCRSSPGGRARRPGTRPPASGGTGRGSPPPAGPGTGCSGRARSGCRGTAGSPRPRDRRRRPGRGGSAPPPTGRAARSSRTRSRGAAPSRSRASARPPGSRRRTRPPPWRDWCRRTGDGRSRRTPGRGRSRSRSPWRARCGGSRWARAGTA